MLITAVDDYCDLYSVQNLLPESLVSCVLQTDWINMPWQRQPGQERWARRRIDDRALPWISQWNQCLMDIWPCMEKAIGRKLESYQGTAWWLDEPGFVCSMHTDGEMPGALHLNWVGELKSLGTAFYHYKVPDQPRYQCIFEANSGYIMINTATKNGYRHLQWHAMLTPVPHNSFRLTSYSWLKEKHDN